MGEFPWGVPEALFFDGGNCDNDLVVWLSRVSCHRNLGVPPSARVLTERWRPTRERCRRGVFKSLAGSAGRIDGVFKSLVPGPVPGVGVSSPSPLGRSGGWSVQVLLPPGAVQRSGADPSGCWAPVPWQELIPPSSDGGDGAFSGASSSPRLRRSRVSLAAPQPATQPTGAQGRVSPGISTQGAVFLSRAHHHSQGGGLGKQNGIPDSLTLRI